VEKFLSRGSSGVISHATTISKTAPAQEIEASRLSEQRAASVAYESMIYQVSISF